LGEIAQGVGSCAQKQRLSAKTRPGLTLNFVSELADAREAFAAREPMLIRNRRVPGDDSRILGDQFL
jgi:hypothetical protein